MKAVVFDAFGGPEVLHPAQVDTPQPGPGQVRVKVRAAGVNPVDSKIRSGGRQADFPTPLPAILGVDLAGSVDAVGDGVNDVTVGDEVLGWADAPAGSYAEYALASTFTRKPAGLSFVDAVTIPASGEAANRGLDKIGVTEGDTVLIHGAAGGVGTMAVQLAKARGATVIGTASEQNQDYVRSLGATPVVYGQGLADRVRAVTSHVDAVLDVAGKGGLPDSIKLRGGTDRIVTLSDPAAGDMGVEFTGGGGPSDRLRSNLAKWAAQAADGELRTTVDKTFPLDRAADAQREIQSGHSRGKRVLIVEQM